MPGKLVDPRPTVAVCVAARDEVKTSFCHDFVQLTGVQVSAGNINLVAIFSQGTILPSQRIELVLNARSMNATHILFLDSDMRFPADTVQRLLDRRVEVVGANCARRRMPTGPTAGNYDKETGKKQHVYTYADSTGLERVDVLGTGVLLIDMRVFDRLPQPWFATPWVENQGFMGEDVYLCKLLREAGIPIYVDHDLSRQIGHTGEWVFKHQHVVTVRDMEEKKVPDEQQAAQLVGA